MRFTCAAETRATRCESSMSRRISTSHNRWLVQKEWPARAKKRPSGARLASINRLRLLTVHVSSS